MKKIFLLTAISLTFGLLNQANALNLTMPDLPKFPKKSQQSEIRTLLKNHNKAIQEHRLSDIKVYYDDSYKSADGYNLEDLTTMLDKAHKTYGNIKYKTKINNITAFDNWALAQMSDTSIAKIYPDNNKKNKDKMGVLEGTSSYVVYLKNTPDGWKIISDDVLMEETSLKYGIANKINMDLVTPAFIQNGQEYDLSLKMDKPDDIIALASISREEISYPPVDAQEKFRKFPSEGELERLVRANNKNLDEYAIASVGFTRISFSEEQAKAKIEILGMAYIMKRINNEILNLPAKGASEKN